jgi:hypothetical protein
MIVLGVERREIGEKDLLGDATGDKLDGVDLRLDLSLGSVPA